MEHKDLPDDQLHKIKGASSAFAGQIPIADGFGDAPFTTAPFSKTRMGFVDVADSQSTTLTLSSANTLYQINNDGVGTNTQTAYALPSMVSIWNVGTNYFDFSDMQLGDTVDIRSELIITTTSANNNLDLILELGIGSSTPYSLNVGQYTFKTAGTYTVSRLASIYIGNAATKDYPARFVIKNDTTGSTLKTSGFFIRGITNG